MKNGMLVGFTTVPLLVFGITTLLPPRFGNGFFMLPGVTLIMFLGILTLPTPLPPANFISKRLTNIFVGSVKASMYSFIV